MTTQCDYCNGSLVEQSEPIEIAYRGQTHLRPSLCSICDGCGVEITTAEQTRQNKSDTLALREEIDKCP